MYKFISIIIAALIVTPSALAVGPPYDVDLYNQTFICSTPQVGTRVHVVVNWTDGTRGPDAVRLSAGCTGSLDLDVDIVKGADCVKVHEATDLVVTGRCSISDRSNSTLHQDFIQVMSGRDVTFSGFQTTAPSAYAFSGAIHSSFFANFGVNNLFAPTRVVCDGCNLYGGETPVQISNSVESGVRNSTIQKSYFFGTGKKARCVVIKTAEALSPVNINNTCVA
jgi:hypothetical protein